MNDIGRIYVLKNKANDKVYIGQTTVSLNERLHQHLKPSTIKSKHQYKLYSAIDELGSDKFYIELLEDNVDYNLLDEREEYWIDYYDSFNNGYNSTPGGKGGKLIFKEEDVNRIIDMLKSGKTKEEVSKEFNCNQYTIVRTLKYNGYDNAESIQPNRKVNRELILSMYLDGYTNKKISEIIKCNEKTVRRVLDYYNIPKRKRRKVVHES